MGSKCKIKGKYAEYLCDSLSQSYAGVVSGTIVSYASGEREVMGDIVWLKQGKEKIAINFCPFCGEMIFDCEHPKIAE